jgi:hypothetical protein
MAEKEPDNGKLKELILFICQRSLGDPRFGATKLNKLLFYTDFFAYLSLGNAITWQPYQKLKNGPAPRRLLPLLEEMRDSGDAAQARHQYFGREQIRTIALRDSDLSKFSAQEIALVTEVIDYFWESNASQMSDFSHEFRGWKLAADGEDIPYEVALIQLDDDQHCGLNYSEDFITQLRELSAA